MQKFYYLKKTNLLKKHLFFIFFNYQGRDIQSLLNFKRKISGKIEVSSSKNEEEYRCLVIFKFSEKNDPKKFAVNMIASKIFYKNNDISKFK